MKFGLLNLIKKSTLPALLVGSLLAVSSPLPLLAEGHGGGHGGGGRSFGGAQRGFSGGGRNFSERGNFRGGEREFRGHRDYDRGRDYGGLRFGYGYYGAPAWGYSYSPYGCDPAGYYDQWGNWQPYPGCYVAPY